MIMSNSYDPIILFFNRCVQSWHNEPFFSPHSFSLSVILMWRNRGEYVDFVFSPSCPWLRFQPAPLWSSHCLETLPRDPWCILEKRAPIRNGAHPNWHLRGHGRLACSQVPAAVLRACTLGRASIIHCLLFINNLPPPHTCTHTVPPPLPCAAHPYLHFYISYTIFYYIDISHRLWCFFTLAVSNVSFSAKCTVCWSDCLSHLSLPA